MPTPAEKQAAAWAARQADDERANAAGQAAQTLARTGKIAEAVESLERSIPGIAERRRPDLVGQLIDYLLSLRRYDDARRRAESLIAEADYIAAARMLDEEGGLAPEYYLHRTLAYAHSKRRSVREREGLNRLAIADEARQLWHSRKAAEFAKDIRCDTIADAVQALCGSCLLADISISEKDIRKAVRLGFKDATADEMAARVEALL